MRMGPWRPVASAQRAQRFPVTFFFFFFFFLKKQVKEEEGREGKGREGKSEFFSLSLYLEQEAHAFKALFSLSLSLALSRTNARKRRN